jgi:ribosome-binding factor A
MSRRRIERLNEQLKRELAGLLRTRVRDPRLSDITIVGVRTAPDLTLARVAFRTLGDEAVRREVLEGLDAAAPFLRGALGRTLHIRRVPELVFQEDRSLDRAARIDELLDEVRPEGGWHDDAEHGDGPEPDGPPAPDEAHDEDADT